MFERLQKPFLTVETGEAYQPIRLTYELLQPEKIAAILNALVCCDKNPKGNTWNWFWRNECDDIPFESLDSFTRNAEHPVRLGTFTLRDNTLFLNLPSFKRACLAVPFFHRVINPSIAKVKSADFINKVFGTDERLPHGFTELFKDDELNRFVSQRVSDYDSVQAKCEQASSADEALVYLADFTKVEAQKRLPYAERYVFEYTTDQDPDVVFLSFYIFLRGRELVAIRRWFGNAGYSLYDAAEETVEKVFGAMNIDVIE
jgi:hypothetical protein